MKQSETSRPIYDVINPEFCAALQEKHPQLKQYNIHEVVGDFNDYLANVISTYRDGVLLPSYIGNMFISLFPTKLNQYTQMLADQAVKHQFRYSIDTADGYVPKVMNVTCKVAAKFAHAKYWGFETGTKLSDKVVLAFKQDWKRWIILPNTRFVRGLFQKRKFIDMKKAEEKERMKTYDEFKFE